MLTEGLIEQVTNTLGAQTGFVNSGSAQYRFGPAAAMLP
jgi:hypothetical protein